MTKTVLVPEAPDFQQELSNLGFTLDQLREIGMRILAARQQVTAHDAATAPGQYAYLAGVRALRDVMVPEGWKKLSICNQEFLVNDTNTVRLLTCGGDQYTGNSRFSPKAKNKRGEKTKDIIHENKVQLSLWPSSNIEPSPLKDSGASTWVLLHFFDEIKNEMRIELSLPINYSDLEENIALWEKRILLPAIKVDEPVFYTHQDDNQDFDFEIRRKQNE